MSRRRWWPVRARLLAPGLAALLGVGVGATAAAAQSGGAAAARNPRLGGWTADRRELMVGDVITVRLDERTLASGRKEQNGSDDQSRDLGVRAAPPSMGPDAMGPIEATVRSNKRASSAQRGDMRRDLAFAATVTVRVVARTPEGNFQVRGTRVLDVEKNKQEISVAGIVRPQDVSPAQEVDGDRLADAQIVVKGKGMGKTRGGLVGRMIGMVWP